MKKEKKLNDILKILAKRKLLLSDKFGVTDLAIFGSYARSQQKGSSDIDIYVELKKEFKTYNNFMDLKFYLEDLLENRKVDLVTKHSIRRELQPAIFEEAVHV